MSEKRERNPFSLEEHGLLGEARRTDDLEYLKQWSKDAFTYHEMEKGRLMKELDNMHSDLKEIRLGLESSLEEIEKISSNLKRKKTSR